MIFKEFQDLSLVQNMVLIEHCTDCQKHNQSLWHDERKYKWVAEEISSAIKSEMPFINVFIKPFQQRSKGDIQKLGCLEVYFKSNERKDIVLVGSKLKTLKWPHPSKILQNIQRHLKGIDLEINPQFDYQFCQFLNGIVVYLINEWDKNKFIESLLQNQKQKFSKQRSSALAFKREFSSIVQKWIQSGIISEKEIADLQSGQIFVQKRNISEESGVFFADIKPGKYCLYLQENEFVYESQKNFEVLNNQEQSQSITFMIKQKLVSKLRIIIILNEHQIKDIWLLDSQQKDVKIHMLDNDEYQETSSEIQFETTQLFNIKEVYLEVNLSSKEVVNQIMQLQPGFNRFTFDLNKKQQQLIQSKETEKTIQNQENENINSANFDSQILNNNKNYELEWKNKYNTDIKNDQQSQKQIQQDIQQDLKVQLVQSELRSQNSISFDEEFDQNISIQEEEQQSKYQENVYQRVPSANRIRPGERIQSSKSIQQHIQINENKDQMISYVFKTQVSTFKDSVWENFKVQKQSLSIFVPQNDSIQMHQEINASFTTDQLLAQNKILINQQNNYQEFRLKYTESIKFVRIYLQIQKKSAYQLGSIYISFQDNLQVINIEQYLSNYLNNEEQYIDLCTIFNGIFGEFVLFQNLTVSQQKISSQEGFKDIYKVVQFVNNSKFDLCLFFGFDQRQENEKNNQDFLVSFEQAKESLESFAIELSSEFLLNQIRYKKQRQISLLRLRQVFPQWIEIAQYIEDTFNKNINDVEQDLSQDSFNSLHVID